MHHVIHVMLSWETVPCVGRILVSHRQWWSGSKRSLVCSVGTCAFGTEFFSWERAAEQRKPRNKDCMWLLFARRSWHELDPAGYGRHEEDSPIWHMDPHSTCELGQLRLRLFCLFLRHLSFSREFKSKVSVVQCFFFLTIHSLLSWPFIAKDVLTHIWHHIFL